MKTRKTKEKAGQIDKVIGERIKAARQKKGWSQTDLGEQIAVSFQQVQKYEAGTNRISVARLLELCRVFKKPLGHFIRGLA